MKRISEHALATWRAFLTAHARVIARIENDLAARQRVPLTTYDVLLALYEAPNKKLRMSDLADRVVLTRSGLTRLVDRLEKEGFIKREPTDEDRRGTYAVLTREGRRAFLRTWPTYAAGISAYFADVLTEDELRVMMAALRKVIEASGEK